MPLVPPTEAKDRPFTVGLTGGIGSGKSSVAERFARHGICVIDTDLIAHQLTAPRGAAMPAILTTFGSQMQAPDGALDRTAMRKLVFTDDTARARLESILHPLIQAECATQLHRAASPYVVLVVPLLIESGTYRSWCDRILVVDCPCDLQTQRVVARSGLREDEVQRILAAQADRASRLAAASEVIDNAGDLSALDAQVAELHRRYLLTAALQTRNS